MLVHGEGESVLLAETCCAWKCGCLLGETASQELQISLAVVLLQINKEWQLILLYSVLLY